ncbi:hypothetical protein Dalk_4598 [Desulfatibacillum aliphaticivorans]|uniref:Uncharacterized protein n=1 Tax=Desulfatibacillum aliphaticivorans TaxID=218208 RepID=B8FNJ5_DESAL|nr:hypothetical protein [Desulfatibacillum aliphaticivorans]ACL06276.1 hypothetical protein Dalk_4598 [Desulfatibacillum aliphaticivorans]
MNELMVQNGNNLPVDPAAVAARESARAVIESAYQMALYRPRNEDEARDRILTACKRPGFAADVEYSKPIGGKPVTGPSIRFVELGLREWGNVKIDSPVIYEDDNIRRVRVTVLDLQTNAQFTKDIQVKKTVERKSSKGREDGIISERKNTYGDTVYILRATDEEVDVKASSAISKAIRTEGGRLLPQDIVSEALAIAKETLRKADAADPDAAKRKILDAFSPLGVKPRHIKEYLGHDIETMSPAELQELRGVYSAIKEGGTTWTECMEAKRPESQGDSPKDLTDKINGNTEKPKPTKKAADPKPEPDPEADAAELAKLKKDAADLEKHFKEKFDEALEKSGLTNLETLEDYRAFMAAMADV